MKQENSENNHKPTFIVQIIYINYPVVWHLFGQVACLPVTIAFLFPCTGELFACSDQEDVVSSVSKPRNRYYSVNNTFHVTIPL